ncbi:MAG: hypothetical protein IT209_10905 [Armatimonadetes bacterium]|nr:hypothetical protein [Armatimonadota bacterium]
MSVLIRRRASLVYELTEDLRQRLTSDLQDRLTRSSVALEALDTMLASGQREREAALKKERDRLVRARSEVSARLAQLSELNNETEITQGSVELLCELKVGDSEERLREAQIVIRDGLIREIRNG